MAFVRFEHGCFGAQILVKFFNLVERIDNGDVMLAKLLDPLLVLRELDSFFRLVGIILGDNLQFVWNGDDDELDAAAFERVLECDDLRCVVVPALGGVEQAFLQEQPSVLAFDGAGDFFGGAAAFFHVAHHLFVEFRGKCLDGPQSAQSEKRHEGAFFRHSEAKPKNPVV